MARTQATLDAARDEIAGAGGRKVHAYSCDVSDAGQINETFSTVCADLGQVDILVNNAGTSQPATFTEFSDETWQADIDLKLMAVVRLCRLAMPGMQERRWCRIINVLNWGAKAPWGGAM